MSAPDGVGFIGLGNIGAPMARRLVDWPAGLVVCDVRPDATAPFAEAGATVAATPAEVVAAAGVISVMVLDDDQVTDVVAGDGGVLSAAAPGTVVAIHSTITEATALALAARADELDVHVVDAPVSGGFMGAHEGTLAVMLGGDDDAVAACRPVFERWASLVVHLGPVGAGTRAKLARNLMHFVAYAAAGEAQRLADAAGISLRKLAQVVRHSDAVTGGASAVMVRDTAAPFGPDDPLYGSFAHARSLGEKDLALGLAMAEELGVHLPLATLARERLADELGVPHDLEEAG